MSERASIDTIITLSYLRDDDSYFLRSTHNPIEEMVFTPFTPGGAFFVFDNAHYGKFVAADFASTDDQAVNVMQSLFGEEFKLHADSMLQGAKLYDRSEMKTEMIVPYSNKRRLALIAFHAIAHGASREVQLLAEKIVAQPDKPFSVAGDGGEVPLL